MKITYITGNKAKVGLAKQFLEPLGIEIDNRKIQCPEIQADTFEEVAKYSSKYASEILKCDVLKNDSGLVVEALNGFPGVRTKRWFDGTDRQRNLALIDKLKGISKEKQP